jgi:hypothetical protein
MAVTLAFVAYHVAASRQRAAVRPRVTSPWIPNSRSSTPHSIASASAAKTPIPADRGYVFVHESVPQVPWSIYVLKAQLHRPDLQLDTVMGRGSVQGLGLVSEMARSVPAAAGKAVAAINGDFYYRARATFGDPEGLQITRGELVSGPLADRICCYVDAAGNPHRTNVIPRFQVIWPNGAKTPFGLNEGRDSDSIVLYTAASGSATRNPGGLDLILEPQTNSAWLPLQIGKTYSAKVARLNERGYTPLAPNILVLSIGPRLVPGLPTLRMGDVLQLSTATMPDLAGAQTAIGGGPTLVAGGKPWHWSGFFQPRHPRSAIGWNKDCLFMVEVDGRQYDSLGMSYAELANYLIKLGCEEAINLDGGGSSTLWVDGRVVNNPSEGGERPAANALVLLKKPAKAANR